MESYDLPTGAWSSCALTGWRLDDAACRGRSTTSAPSTALWLEHTLEGSAAEVTYQHGLAEVVAAVRDGRASAAVLIRPVSVEEIRRTAEEGLLMPPKSTYFTPKLQTGLVLRDMS